MDGWSGQIRCYNPQAVILPLIHVPSRTDKVTLTYHSLLWLNVVYSSNVQQVYFAILGCIKLLATVKVPVRNSIFD